MKIKHIYTIAQLDDEGRPRIDRIKLGISDDPVTRINQLKTGSATELVLVNTWLIKNTEDVEKVLHQLFADCLVRREWFDFSKADAWEKLMTILNAMDIGCLCKTCMGYYQREQARKLTQTPS